MFLLHRPEQEISVYSVCIVFNQSKSKLLVHFLLCSVALCPERKLWFINRMPQNPRGICIGRDLWRSSGLILHSEQDQLEQVAEGHVNFEYFQGWNSTTSLKNCSTHLVVSKGFPNVYAAMTWALTQVSCRDCCVSLFGDTQKLPQYGSGKAALGDDLHRCFPTSTLCDSVVSNRISFAASCWITLTSEKSGPAFPVPFPSGNSRQQ